MIDVSDGNMKKGKKLTRHVFGVEEIVDTADISLKGKCVPQGKDSLVYDVEFEVNMLCSSFSKEEETVYYKS